MERHSLKKIVANCFHSKSMFKNGCSEIEIVQLFHKIMPNYEIRQCNENSCGLRFPIGKSHPRGHICPRCGAPTLHCVDIDATELEELHPSQIEPKKSSERPVTLGVVLDNIRSLLNVGAIFRSADGVGANHLYLCGITPTPENPKLSKTALGAEKAVPWSQYLNGLEAVQRLQEEGHHIWALESPSSLKMAPNEVTEIPSLPHQFSVYNIPPIKDDSPITLVVGNEITGIDPHILALCECTLYIPMHGVKHSLNVATATGIALYMLNFSSQPHMSIAEDG